MDKIEKLEIPDTNAVIGLADRDGKEIEIKAIGRKINEIIDYLNQSQKQPEGLTDSLAKEAERTIDQPFEEEDTKIVVSPSFYDKLNQEDKKGYIKSEPLLQKQPEKQEEWGEIDKDIWYEVGGKKYVFIKGEEYIRTKDVSQLLSEKIKEAREEGRTDVLERLEKWSTNPQQGVFYDVGCNCQERLLRFLSKLLKEEE